MKTIRIFRDNTLEYKIVVKQQKPQETSLSSVVSNADCISVTGKLGEVFVSNNELILADNNSYEIEVREYYADDSATISLAKARDAALDFVENSVALFSLGALAVIVIRDIHKIFVCVRRKDHVDIN